MKRDECVHYPLFCRGVYPDKYISLQLCDSMPRQQCWYRRHARYGACHGTLAAGGKPRNLATTESISLRDQRREEPHGMFVPAVCSGRLISQERINITKRPECHVRIHACRNGIIASGDDPGQMIA